MNDSEQWDSIWKKAVKDTMALGGGDVIDKNIFITLLAQQKILAREEGRNEAVDYIENNADYLGRGDSACYMIDEEILEAARHPKEGGK